MPKWFLGLIREWVHWKLRERRRGYPPHSFEGRAVERAGAAPNPPRGHIILTESNPLAERMDIAYRQLSADHRAVLEARYLTNTRNDRKAHLVGLTGAEYRNRVKVAHRRWLSFYEKK